MIDFCTSSILRPDVLERCYQSFDDNLKNIELKKCRLFLSIDPAPSPPWKHTPEQNIKVASKFFGSVVARVSKNTSLSQAVKWCWSKADTDFIFLLEDDWELFKPVDVSEMLGFFEKNRKLNQVRLMWRNPKYHAKRGHTRAKWSYGLSPGITRKSFYKRFAKTLDTPTPMGRERRCNPERFIRKCGGSPVKKVLYYPNFQVVKDTGGEWKLSHKFKVFVGGKGKWQPHP